MKCTTLTFIIALLVLASPASAEIALTNTKAIQAAIDAKDRPEADRARDVTSKPLEIFSFFGVRPGMQVAELMAGAGYNVELISRIVGPAGSVIAHNNNAYYGFAKEGIGPRYANDRLPNAKQLTTELNDMQIGKEQLDLVLMVMSFHDAYWVNEKEWPAVDTGLFMKQIYDALKPGGIVAVIDHFATDGSGTSAIDSLHRIDEAFVRAEFQKAGFEFVGSSDLLRNPADDRTLLVFDEKIRGKTDRFVHKYRRPHGK